MIKPITQILTIKEASEVVGCDVSTIRKKIYRGCFTDSEVRKSGDTWLIERKALLREFNKN